MKAIEIMINEHNNIKRVLKVMRILCYKVLKNEEIDLNIFDKIIDFVRNYADKHHHCKEEDILFKKMAIELKSKIGEGPILGMLTEHDQGRLFIKNLESSLEKVKNGEEEAKLDLIANSVCYADLLYRHIDKEDKVIYKFGEKNLSEESVKEVEYKCNEVERIANNENFQNKYVKLIEDIEKYIDIN